MDDLFEREQQVYDEAAVYLERWEQDGPFDVARYELLVREYGKILKHLRMVTKISDRTAVSLNASKQNLLDKVHCDAMTGIYNRRYLAEQIGPLFERLEGAYCAALMIDVDFFKRYNDTYGHGMGDDCLCAVAKTMQQLVTMPQAFIARYGGEEFAVLLPGADESAAREMAQRLLEGIRALRIPHIENEAAGYVTISIGLTAGRVDAAENGKQFIRQADRALYAAKGAGRDQYIFLDLRDAE